MVKAQEFLERENLAAKESAEDAETSIPGEAEMLWKLALCRLMQHFGVYQLQSQHQG